MDMMLESVGSVISVQEEVSNSNIEWDENNWVVMDFNDAFEANLHLGAPFDS